MSELADVTFNSPAPWDDEKVKGPAMRVPLAFLDFKLTGKIWVEFLPVGASKNHVVFRATLETEQVIDNTKYFAVRISMDTADKAFEVLNDDETDYYYDKNKSPGDDYHSGQMNIKFLKYSMASDAQQKTLGFNIIRSDLTLGNLIGIAKSTNIYKFVFMRYQGVTLEVWKGCRDFILQFWLCLVENDIITDKDDEGVSLVDVIAFFYAKDKDPRHQPVDKGEWPTTFARIEAKDKVGNVYEPLE